MVREVRARPALLTNTPTPTRYTPHIAQHNITR